MNQENCFWYWGLKTNQASFPSWDLIFCLSGPSTTLFQILHHCWGKLWSSYAGLLKTAKTTKQSSPYSDLLYEADISNFFEQLGWKTLSSQRQIERATMVFKSPQGLASPWVSLLEIYRSLNSFSSGAVLWNSLPLELWNYGKQSLSSISNDWSKRVSKPLFDTRHSWKAAFILWC